MIRTRLVAVLAGLVLVGDAAALVVLPDPAPPAPSADAPAVRDAGSGADVETLGGQVERVRGHVERIRGLVFPGVPAVRHVTRDALATEVVAQLDAYGEQEADLDQRLLVALGQLERDADLRALLLTAYGEQVAGFYDPETTELVVGTDDPTVRAGRLDEVTLAHELGHSLVDATLGLPDIEAVADRDLDAALALQALVEGDASAVMAEYVQVAMSPVDALLLAQEALALADRVERMTLLPASLQRGLEFPYVEGLAFVQHLLDRGGWAAVDAAYADPPTTTLEVLDPARHGRVEPSVPSAFGTPGPEWGAADRSSTFGAFDLLVLLQLPGNDRLAAIADARALALAWEGGAVRQWSQGPATAIALHVRHRRGVDLCTPLRSWYLAAHPDATVVAGGDGVATALDGVHQDASIACDDDEVRIGIAPDVATAERAIAA